MIIEPIRADYHPFRNRSEYFPPRLNSPDRLQDRLRVVGGEGAQMMRGKDGNRFKEFTEENDNQAEEGVGTAVGLERRLD